mmetsp:Transcript_4584/g.17324  ORF Transcript_4584/g.17324 Transcript_4584/m.17324 type:complete len:88 (-) Transcript_4584:351-614(-)
MIPHSSFTDSKSFSTILIQTTELKPTTPDTIVIKTPGLLLLCTLPPFIDHILSTQSRIPYISNDAHQNGSHSQRRNPPPFLLQSLCF